MLSRIVEIADDNRHLHAYRGFMVVEDSVSREKVGQVPLDDIGALIANAHGITYTNNLLVALAGRGAPLIVCTANHNVAAMLVAVEGHHLQAKRFDAQIAATKPTQKRLWADLVRAKITQQAATLKAVGSNNIPVSALAARVRSGDPDNLEAQAARRYWPLLLGEAFRRDASQGGTNALLNYGYTVLRAATARAVVAAGLHPTVGLHHANQGNGMRLVDDLMEPFRPIIDLRVWQLVQSGRTLVSPETKRYLALTMFDDMETAAGTTPLSSCLLRLATSLAFVFLREREKLDLPIETSPLLLMARRAPQ